MAKLSDNFLYTSDEYEKKLFPVKGFSMMPEMGIPNVFEEDLVDLLHREGTKKDFYSTTDWDFTNVKK